MYYLNVLNDHEIALVLKLEEWHYEIVKFNQITIDYVLFLISV